MRILIFNNGYHAVQECQEAFNALEHETQAIEVNQPDYFQALTDVLGTFRPDLVFSINHAGFDEAGAIAQHLANNRICQAIWYIDSPFYVQGADLSKQANPFAAIFSWERGYLADFTEAGYPAAVHLPLATDPKRFFRQPTPYQYDISFVGSTWRQQQARWGFPPDSLQHLFFKHPPQKGEWQAWAKERGIQLTTEECLQLEIWATVQDRQTFARGIESLNAVFFGDPGWQEWLNKPENFLGGTRYRVDTPEIYRSTKISLNLTHWQMPTAVNQRIFDVPACGGFLLTDYQADLDYLFEPGEICRYHSLEEAQALVRHYLVHEAERLAMVQKAHQRVVLEHTYLERMARLLTIFD